MQIGKWHRKIRLRYFGVILCATLGCWIFMLVVKTDFPPFARTRAAYRPSDIWIVDRAGLPLESIRSRETNRSLEWVKLDDVSPAFVELLIRAEDRRFFSHPGFDAFAALGALKTRFARGSNRGASTLTMQLVGLKQKRGTSTTRSYTEKFRQIFSALQLELEWSKREILEAYINLVSFRGELTGLRAASLGYFAKNPMALDRAESALLVAQLRSPNSAPELVGRRACQLVPDESCAELKARAISVFSKPYRLGRTREIVPILSSRFIENPGPQQSVVRTSIDARIQKIAMDAIREQLRELKDQNVRDASALVIETRTGRVVAYAANGGSRHASAVQIDGIRMRRQAGSTIKPFIYANAFELKLLTPTSLLNDSPADLAVGYGRVYHPQNYDHQFRGYVGAADALASSLNVPAVRALKLVGESEILSTLEKLGFENLEDREFYGPSLALGTVDVSLWELVQAYRQLVVDTSPYSAETRTTLFNILSSPEHRRFTFGIESQLNLPFAVAAKTGTSKDMRDNWCIGWTSEYVVGVWVGNFGGQPMWNVSGISGAAPIWRHLMLELHPRPPANTSAPYDEPSSPLKKRKMSSIRYPPRGMIVGIDPEIPTTLQKLPIEVENPIGGQKIFVNGRPLGPSRETVFWPIRRGKFVVQLKDRNAVVDETDFEVR